LKQTKISRKVSGEDSKSSVMPTGYYSGDKLNINLRGFVEAHVRERPYDPVGDDYDVKAFDKPITTTKATAIYNMHTYWSKKPHTAITEYIRHYTTPGDLVLDPMCGSGGTALAALMEGRKAVAIDVSPAATFITKNYCTPVDVGDLKDALEELEERIKFELDWLYETRCDGCGGKATTLYTVYSQRFQCPRCLDIVPLFDCIEAKVPAKTHQKGKPADLKEVMVCPYCKSKGHLEEISTRTKHFGAVPVLVSYECLGGCTPKRRQRQYNDVDRKKREFFEKYDLAKIAEIEAKPIPYWYPPHRMMNVESDTAPWGDEWRLGRNFRKVAELFTKRNLWAIALIKQEITALFEKDIADIFNFALSASLRNVSKMIRESCTQTMCGTYYIPQVSKEVEVSNSYFSRIKSIIKGYQEINLKNCKLVVSSQSAADLSGILDNSVDYVFTDPPYGGNVQYGELNFIWEAWLGLNTSWHNQEIIVNETRGITEADWRNLMMKSMGEVFRVLKPGRWVSLCYHDTSEGTWQLLQDLMTEVGFLPSQTDSALYIDTGQKSYNQFTADKVTKRDLVFNYRKPKPGESSSFLLLTGNEDARSFNEKACAVIRDFLLDNPGATKDRVYDTLVTHMVSRSQMQAHNFDTVLGLVAESASAGSSGAAERWYLKDEELDFVDVAETAKEDAAADSVKSFIHKYRKNNPEFDGIHYSDVFEYYLYSVKDKPRRELKDWLLDYFFVTSDGTYRPPLTTEEDDFKRLGRVRGLNRKIKRLVGFIEQDLAVPDTVRPDNLTLVEWILHSRRAGLYLEGKLLFERAGLDLDALSEEMKVELEEAYQTCNKMTANQSN
jgi:hypothetical protein